MVGPPRNVPGSFLDGRRCTLYKSTRPEVLLDCRSYSLISRTILLYGYGKGRCMVPQYSRITAQSCSSKQGLLCGTGFFRINVGSGVRSAYVSPNAFAACCFR